MTSALQVERVNNWQDFGLCCCLRTMAFVIEQNCPPLEEFDEIDRNCDHYLGRIGGAPATTCRAYVENHSTARIGRVVTAKEHRGKGYALEMLDFVLSDIVRDPTIIDARLGAQIPAMGLYEKLGFEAYGDEFIEAGIPHRMMRLELSKRFAA